MTKTPFISTGCKLASIAAGVVLVSGPVVGFAGGGAWQGSEITKDGVAHVVNSAEGAIAPATLRLEERWRLGGDDESDEFFGVLTQIDTDENGNVYLLDVQLNEVFIYTSDGEFIRTVGREGEGPGEFRRPADMFIAPDGKVAVIQRMPGKIVLLTTDGDPAGNFPLPDGGDGPLMLSRGRCAGDEIVLSVNQFARTETEVKFTMAVARLGGDGSEISRCLERTDTRNLANIEFNEKTSSMGLIWEVGADGKIYASSDFDAYRIDVYDRNGKLDRVITREYEPRKRTQAEIDRVKNSIRFRGRRRAQQPKITISETERAIRQLFPREDGSMWVLSGRGAAEAADGAIGSFDVFDADGRFQQQVTLLGEGDFQTDGFYFAGNRLYVVTDLWSALRAMRGTAVEEEEYEEEEPMPVAVICYDLQLNVHGMR